MGLNAMPAIDAQACSGWTQQQLGLYNSLPFYLTKMSIDRRRTWALWSRFTKKKKWTPNQGDTMKAVRSEPSPHLRQFFNPTLMRNLPRKDVMDVREVTSSAQLYRHRFESLALNFFPSFNDFMDEVDANAKDIMEKIERAEDLFIRSRIYHMSPFAFTCQLDGSVRLVASNPWSGTGQFDPAVDGKTTAWMNANVLNGANAATGNLQLACLIQALNILETDLRIPFFSGSDLPKDDAPLAGQYCLVCSSEAYNQFSVDPFLLANKNIQLDIIKDQYRGSFFGRFTARLEDLPLRFDSTATFSAPEVRVEGGNPYNAGETLPSPKYSTILQPDQTEGSPWEVAYFVGAPGYESIGIGAPPSAFTKDEMPLNFPSMWWNGQVRTIKRLLMECVDEDTDEVKYEMDDYGENLQFKAQVAFGILATQRRNVIPIYFRRKRGQ